MEEQRPVFIAQIRLAKKYHLPLVMHTRKAGWEVLKLLEAEGAPPRGVFHCIEDDELLVRAVTKAGWHAGFGGTCTYPKNQPLRDILTRVDRSKVILETDAPYLAPQPVRGKRNEPSFVAHVAGVVAQAWGVSISEVHRITTANASALFLQP
jgi:TatD DNase family protein